MTLLATMVAACSGPVAVPSASPAATPSLPTEIPVQSAGPSTAVLVGAGDIAQCETGASHDTDPATTAALVAQIPGIVFTAGDDAYESGTDADFSKCYNPTWGAFKDRTLLPAVGNHDFYTPGGSGYFSYFGSIAGTPGQGWYSSDIGGWHIVVLNSNCAIVGCTPDSPQVRWLQADLAAHPATCTMAIWHHPRFSSGFHGDDLAVAPFWDALAAAHTDLIINGHDHDYERFAPQDPSGALDVADGIHEIIVGTGGAELRPFEAIKPNSVIRDAGTFGVLVLTLHASSYDWRFVPVAGSTFTDSGSANCH